MAKSNDIFWVRPDVFNNQVTLPVWVWNQHASKHEFDVYPASEEHMYQSIIDPDAAHRNLDPASVYESCIFVKTFSDVPVPFIVPVLYDEIQEPNEYEKGREKGRVLTGYFRMSQGIGGSFGPMFWSKQLSNDGDSK